VAFAAVVTLQKNLAVDQQAESLLEAQRLHLRVMAWLIKRSQRSGLAPLLALGRSQQG
jgi:hypothetical protein